MMTTQPMTSCSFGDVVLVAFPFTDQTATKKRPAVVLHRPNYQRRHQDVILMAITSRIRKPLKEDEGMIHDWNHAGLIKPSMFKPLIATLEQALIIRKLGTLTERGREILGTILHQVLDI